MSCIALMVILTRPTTALFSSAMRVLGEVRMRFDSNNNNNNNNNNKEKEV